MWECDAYKFSSFVSQPSCLMTQSPLNLSCTRLSWPKLPCPPPLDWRVYFTLKPLFQKILLVVAALALCVALSMFVADKYLENNGSVLESNSSDEDNIECVTLISHISLLAELLQV